VVAGEALIDLLIDHDGGIQAVMGGGPFNTARTLGLLGADCTYLGVLADDHFGELLRSELAATDVALACPAPTTAPTSLAVAQLDTSGSATYRFYLDGTSMAQLSAREAREGLPVTFDALHVGTLGMVVEPTASVLEGVVAEVAAERLIVLDPNCRPAVVTDVRAFRERAIRLMELADVIKLSDEDAAYLFPVGGFEEFVAGLTDGGTIVIRTAGAEPIDVFAGREHGTVRPPTGRIVDTVGAGDVLGGSVLWALLGCGLRKGRAVEFAEVLSAVEIAAVAAHMSCQVSGAKPPTLAELQARLAASGPLATDTGAR
jgi:fructokinase